MIEKLIAEHPWMLLPLAVVVGVTYGAKALYVVQGSFAQRRKEFLESWHRDRAEDDIWLEMSIRQVFGKFIPSDVIRPLLAKPDSARALLEVTTAWKFLKYDASSVRWSRDWMVSPRKRFWSVAILNAIYFLSAGIAGLLFLAVILGMGSATAWIWLIGLLGIAFLTLDLSVDFAAASKIVPRRLGLT